MMLSAGVSLRPPFVKSSSVGRCLSLVTAWARTCKRRTYSRPVCVGCVALVSYTFQEDGSCFSRAFLKGMCAASLSNLPLLARVRIFCQNSCCVACSSNLVWQRLNLCLKPVPALALLPSCATWAEMAASAEEAPVQQVEEGGKPEQREPPLGVEDVNLDFSDEDVDDATMAAEGGHQSGDDEDGEGGDDSEVEPDPTKCACCQQEPRKDRNIFGPECKKALDNVEKREVKETNRKGERWAKWCEVKRAGGPRLFSILLSYQDTCNKSTRQGCKRGEFDFMQHYEEVQSVANVETGEKLLYMTLKKWLNVAQEDHALDAKEAKRRWDRKKATIAKHKIRKSPSGVTLLPMPAEYYVVGSNATKHIKGMRMEGKKSKPTAANLAQGEKHVSGGHLGFSDKLFQPCGGQDLVDNAKFGGSLLFAPDGDSIFGAGDNFRSSAPVVTWLISLI